MTADSLILMQFPSKLVGPACGTDDPPFTNVAAALSLFAQVFEVPQCMRPCEKYSRARTVILTNKARIVVYKASL